MNPKNSDVYWESIFPPDCIAAPNYTRDSKFETVEAPKDPAPPESTASPDWKIARVSHVDRIGNLVGLRRTYTHLI